MAIWWDEKKKIWRYEFQFKGERHTGSAKTKGRAREEREDHKKRVQEEAGKRTQTDTAFSTIANLYLDWSEKRHVKQTYEYKKMVLKLFQKFHKNPDIRAITPQMIHEYLNTRPSNHNYNVHRKELSAFFTFVVEQLKVMNHSPVWDLEKMPEEVKRKDIPSQEEFLKILQASNKDERPLLIVLVHTLARIDEILRLTWKDVNFENRIVTLWTRKRKGGNLEPRDIYMNDDLYGTLYSMWKRRVQNNLVFWNKKTETRFTRRPKLMKSLCKRAKIGQDYGFHEIRHFIATYLHDIEKQPTGVIGNILGHKSKRTTEVYLHPVDEAARMAMKKLEGAFSLPDLPEEPKKTKTTHQTHTLAKPNTL
ncbi:MAG: site-specific integrase [Desulfobacteraceae bacterium]|nr:site-specific integrase [Desulfobacteraceae bacterium]